MGQDQINAMMARQITNQGFILAGAELFKLGGILFLAMIPVIWLARRPGPGGRPGRG
jgi:hypothetical protein